MFSGPEACSTMSLAPGWCFVSCSPGGRAAGRRALRQAADPAGPTSSSAVVLLSVPLSRQQLEPKSQSHQGTPRQGPHSPLRPKALGVQPSPEHSSSPLSKEKSPSELGPRAELGSETMHSLTACRLTGGWVRPSVMGSGCSRYPGRGCSLGQHCTANVASGQPPRTQV